MRIVKAPWATWDACWHLLVGTTGAILTVLSAVMFIAAIWTNDARWAGTAGVLITLGIVALITGAMTHTGSIYGCKAETFTVPLPWRRNVEDAR